MNLEARVATVFDALRIPHEEPVGVACSGGADSIALLHLASRSRCVVAMHVDHGLRADSADDATFVGRIAGALGSPFLTRSVIVERTGSLEAAARRARYDALEEMAAEASIACVLTAHTLDDQAETMILRLMRGDALDGIAPVRGIFHRPLLDVRRDELRAWLIEGGIAWRDDPTNDDTRFERNWVRHVLLPQMKERRTGVSDVIARVAGRTRADTMALDAIADEVLACALIDDIGVFVPGSDVPAAVMTRVVRRAFRRLGHDPSSDDVAAALRDPHSRAGSVDVWTLPGGLAFTRVPQPAMPALRLDRGSFESADWQFSVRVGGPEQAPGRWRVPVPADGALGVRSRTPGDRVETRGGHRKVQDVLVDARVPRVLRDLVPIVTVDDRPLTVLPPGSMATSSPGRTIDIEPLQPTWSREFAWMGR